MSILKFGNNNFSQKLSISQTNNNFVYLLVYKDCLTLFLLNKSKISSGNYRLIIMSILMLKKCLTNRNISSK